MGILEKKSNKVSNSKARLRNNNNFQKCLDTLASLDPRCYHCVYSIQGNYWIPGYLDWLDDT